MGEIRLLFTRCSTVTTKLHILKTLWLGWLQCYWLGNLSFVDQITTSAYSCSIGTPFVHIIFDWLFFGIVGIAFYHEYFMKFNKIVAGPKCGQASCIYNRNLPTKNSKNVAPYELPERYTHKHILLAILIKWAQFVKKNRWSMEKMGSTIRANISIYGVCVWNGSSRE